MKPLRIVFAGTPAFSVPTLQALTASQHEIAAVYTQPDRPAGRGQKLQFSPVKEYALSQQIPVLQPLNFKDLSSHDELAALDPDVMVVIAYGLILPQKILNIPRFGCINVHASLLPKWRGASPIQHAILHGDAKTGITIMQMDVGMDTGDMLAKTEVTLQGTETAEQLHDCLATAGIPALLQTLELIQQGNASPIPQPHQLATYAPKILKQQAEINWNQTAVEISRQIRAYYPWPVAFTHTPEETIRILQASFVSTIPNAAPGTILAIGKEGIRVATGNGTLIIERIQFPGGKPITINDWLNSNRRQLHAGLILQ